VTQQADGLAATYASGMPATFVQEDRYLACHCLLKFKAFLANLRLTVPCPAHPAASVLWLPYTAYTLLVRSSAASSSPLADTGETLLLMLACHAPAPGLLPLNHFRQALQRLQVGFSLCFYGVFLISFGSGCFTWLHSWKPAAAQLPCSRACHIAAAPLLSSQPVALPR